MPLLVVVRSEQTFRSEGVSTRSHVVACCQARLRDDCDCRRSPFHIRKQAVTAGLTGEQPLKLHQASLEVHSWLNIESNLGEEAFEDWAPLLR